MSFLTPWSAVVAASIAVPLLLLLYFLKLRRRMLRIPSTLLWQGSVEDLQVNTPFQRLRYSLLLLLQLLVLAAVLLAIAQPRIRGEVDSAPRVVLMIDRSASMQATDVAGPGQGDLRISRLEAAKQAARDIVESLGRSTDPPRVCVLAVADGGQVTSGFQGDRRTLLERIDAIEPSDARSDLAAAFRLADAFTRRVDEGDSEAVDVILLSDGGSAPPEGGFSLQARDFKFVHVGPEQNQPVSNLGLVSFSARREFDDPASVLVFARLANAGAAEVRAVLTLRQDGEIAGLQRLTVPAADARSMGEASATFRIELAAGAVLSLRHNAGDHLRVDDEAWLVVPPPTRPRMALVHADTGVDPFLQEVLSLLDPQSIRVLSAAQFESTDTMALDSGALFDLVVFDRVSPSRLPGVPSLIFGGVPAGVRTTGPPPERGRRLLTWKRQHPLLRHVALDDVVYSGFSGYRLPAEATTLATGPEGPVIVEVPVRGARHVLVGFEPARSNWPVQVGFTVFLQNVVDYLTLAGSGQAGMVFAPGEPVSVRVRTDVSRLVISGPAADGAGGDGSGPPRSAPDPGAAVEVPAAPGSMKILPRLERVGVYDVAGARPPLERVAVSLLSDVETDIRPRPEIMVNARAIAAAAAAEATPRELWPWLVAAAAALLLLEWLTYCRRMSR